MRRFILLGLLTAMAFPAWAAKRVTVAQLEQELTTISAGHKPDAEIARQIASMKLSERLTEATLGRLNAHLDTGSQAVLALQLLADQSAFLDPPASELTATAVPDDATQQRMLEATRNYVARTLPRLPNFLATRSINRYDDSPQELKKGGWPVRLGLHLVDTSSREISVRDERDSLPSAVWQEQPGLISKGEFGSTLGMILAHRIVSGRQEFVLLRSPTASCSCPWSITSWKLNTRTLTAKSLYWSPNSWFAIGGRHHFTTSELNS